MAARHDLNAVNYLSSLQQYNLSIFIWAYIAWNADEKDLNCIQIR